MPPLWHLEGPFWLALWEYLGGSWEQQDGHEEVPNTIFIDFELLSRPFFESVLVLRLPGHFLYRFLPRNWDTWGF